MFFVGVRYSCILYICMSCLAWIVPEQSVASCIDSLQTDSAATDTYKVEWMRRDTLKREGFFKRVGKSLYHFVKDFNDIDESYIEPQKYNFTVMLQSVTTYEMYDLKTKDGNSYRFAPEATMKIGPYVGWRWIFLGYTVDVRHMNLTNGGKTRKEYDLSLYSSMLGLDLYYRETGDNYKLRKATIGEDINTDALKNVPFGGLTSSIKGFNIYYIMNHRRFSYPAAFSQSTVQRKSAGSVLLGLGYTYHKLSFDWEKLALLVEDRLGKDVADVAIDNSLRFGKIAYTDISFSGGYAYNWVFARNWLLAGSVSAALGYKRTVGDTDKDYLSFRDFSFKNFNLDGIGRFGLVWNNTKWYAGASCIIHSYNYSKSHFSTNNTFGSLNIYVGFNFGKKSQYRK